MSLACNRSRSARSFGRFAWGLAAVLAVLISPQAFCGPPTTTTQPDPTFSALLLDGHTSRGRLDSLGPGAITLASPEGAKHLLPLNTVFKLTREVSGSVAALDRSMVVLPEGDRLMRVTLGSASETALEVLSDALGKLSLPLDSLLGWIMVEPSVRDDIDAMWDRVRLEPRKDEVVWLSNGDQLAGNFLGYNRLLKLLSDGKPREIDQSRIVAVGFDRAHVNYPRPKSGYLELTLYDGTRFGVIDSRIDDGTIQKRPPASGGKVRFPSS